MKSARRLYTLKFGDTFVYANDPMGPLYRVADSAGMLRWVTRVNERGRYSIRPDTMVIPVEVPNGHTS